MLLTLIRSRTRLTPGGPSRQSHLLLACGIIGTSDIGDTLCVLGNLAPVDVGLVRLLVFGGVGGLGVSLRERLERGLHGTSDGWGTDGLRHGDG